MSTVDAELEIAETPVLSPGLELTEAREGRVGDITVHIEAIWVSGQVPRGRVALLRKRYPSVLVYGSKRVLLRRHRLSRLDSYRRLPYLEARLAGLRFPFWRQDRAWSTRRGSILATLILLLCWGLLLVLIPAVLIWSL